MTQRMGLEIPTSVVRRLIQRSGISRLDDEAAELWRDFLEEFTLKIFSKLKSDREIKKLRKTDVEEVIQWIKQSCKFFDQ